MCQLHIGEVKFGEEIVMKIKSVVIMWTLYVLMNQKQ